MLPQFQRVVTLSVMCILVALFAWIYQRDRQPRARFWMIGWACIVMHFAGMLFFSFHLISSRLADWSAYATLIFAAAAFFLSVCRIRRKRHLLFWAGIVTPAVVYWTAMVFDVANTAICRLILLLVMSTALALVFDGPPRPVVSMGLLLAMGIAPGVLIFYRLASHVETGMDFLLFEGFAITGWCYWKHFHRLTPGTVLTSLSFLAWGMVFPVAEFCASVGINIPGDNVVWDLPKYFVAFGMMVTLFENQTEMLQLEVAERKRAEEAARAASEANGILMASVSFAARRMLSADGWRTVVPETLPKIGLAARVRRAYVAQANPREAILHEWTTRRPESASAGCAAALAWQGPEWIAHAASLRRGDVVSFEVLAPGDGAGDERSACSVILAPIEVAGEWFGFLGFEDGRRREWTEAERDSFRAAARMLGASMTRQRAQEYVDGILRSMDESLVVTDRDLQIRRVNPSTLRLLGYQEEELIGRPALQLLVERDAPARHTAVERTYRTKSGGLMSVLFSSAEMRNSTGELEGYVWLAQDITELKHVQAELLRAKEAAEEASRAKSSFLANMSHELRTPLNAVIGYSEMLQEVAEERGQQDLLPDLHKIRAAGTHLLGLINDILDLSKIEAGKVKLQIESLAVEAVVEDVVSTIRPLVDANRNRLQVECRRPLGAVLADQTRVRQVLYNLLSNACKFTDHGLIRMEARQIAYQGADWVEFQVIDTGIGMSPSQLETLYRPFMQADPSTTRKYGGTGLGLTISREFCLMMGGSISAESELGKGSTFTLRLPAHPACARADFVAPAAAGREREPAHA